MEVTLAVVFGLVGAALGSFVGACADRLPAGVSLVRPPSFCDSCQHRLSPLDLVPVFSFVWLRRRCRYCRTLIPWRVLLVELATAVLLVLLYLHYGLTAQFGVTAFYFCVFILILIIDMEHGLILNKVVYPVALVALLVAVLVYQPAMLAFAPGAFQDMPAMAARTVSGIAGAATGFLFLMLPALVFPSGMGWGDVKMAGLIGLVVGFPRVLVAVVGAVVLGGIVAIFLLALRVRKRREAIPFGPFLSVSTMITLVYGNDILSWYLGLLP